MTCGNVKKKKKKIPISVSSVDEDAAALTHPALARPSHALCQQLGSCDRDRLVFKPKTFSVWFFTEQACQALLSPIPDVS